MYQNGCFDYNFLQCRKAMNSAGPGARQTFTDSDQHVDQIRTLYESKPLAFKSLVC